MIKRTADEASLIRLYEQSIKDNESKPWAVDELKGIFKQTERRTNTIVRMLAQANFIKKTKDDRYYITSNGISLVESLIGIA